LSIIVKIYYVIVLDCIVRRVIVICMFGICINIFGTSCIFFLHYRLRYWFFYAFKCNKQDWSFQTMGTN